MYEEVKILNEKEVVEKLKNREINAIEQIIEKYHKYVLKIVYTILNGYVAEIDIHAVVNQVFFKVWENAEKLDLDNYESIKLYLSAIAKNTAIDERRKLKNNLPLDELIIGKVNEEMTKIELKHILKNAFEQLSLKYKIVLIKYYFQGKTIHQISKEERIAEATVKTRLKRARENLKIILEKGGYTYED